MPTWPGGIPSQTRAPATGVPAGKYRAAVRRRGNTTTLNIKNYIKPNDLLTLVFKKQNKAIQSIRVASYLDDPTDAVTIAAQFAKLPDGTNHVTGTQINGASKQLSVVTRNSNYQPI